MEKYFNDYRTLSLLRQGPLKTYLYAFAVKLRDEGFGRGWICHQIRLAADFSRWLQLNRIALNAINTEHGKKYLTYRARKGRGKAGDPIIMTRLLNLLRQQGVIVEPILRKLTPVDQAANKFVSYLLAERSLASVTATRYGKFIRRFLNNRFGKKSVDLSILSSKDIVDFVQQEAAYLHVKESQMMTSALRSFLRYARYQGYIDIDLVAAVPTVANRSMATIPKSLPSEQVALVLEHCKRDTATGRRDYAILLLLARLGLRAGEVVSLTLDDIDWQAGCITVHGKGGHRAQLPLPIDVGEAIAAYLRDGRPRRSTRTLFLYAKAPLVGFKSQQVVGDVVDRALERAGIDSPRRGAHQFRHSLATEMLRRGASMAEIGQVLRHQSAQTTEIYAKVDLISLRSLALAWPGGEQ